MQRTSMLELAILGLLKERAMHGYELRQQLSQKLGFFWTVSFGSLYPTLKKLERLKVVKKVLPREEVSRRKQVYRITEAGERMFLELLAEGSGDATGDEQTAAWEEEKFPLRLAFFRYLRPEIRIRLLERRKAYLEDKLAEGQRFFRRAKHGPDDTYTLSLMRHGMETTAADIAWLDELITAERAVLSERESSAPSLEEASAPPEPLPPAADLLGEHAEQPTELHTQ